MKKVSGIELDPAKQLHLLDELQNLLEKQIKLAHQGNISGLVQLSKKTETLVEKIVKTGACASPEFVDRRDKLEKLYKELYLIVTTQKVETHDKLSQVRKGKRLIRSYRSNI